MSFPGYCEYKVADFEELGNVPVHWAVIRLKNALAVPITDGPHETPTFTDDGIRFLSVDGIQDGELQFEGCRYISAESHAEYRAKALPKRDDILMGKAASTGKIARVKVDFEFSIWSPLALIRANPNSFFPAFVEYCLKSPFAQSQIDNFCTSNTQKNISMADIPKIVMPAPPLDEQKTIASFLDAETSKIVGLVAEQRRLIELLKEKRQAVISHAVTKGLNPNAPMKPSGIQWLGDVPQHWDIVALKHLVARPIIDGPHESPQKQDDGIPFVSAESIGKGFIDFEKKWGYISKEDHERYSQRYKPERGDILLVKLGATTGIPAIVETDVEFNVWVPLAAIRLEPQYQPRFIFHVLRSNNLRVAYELNWTLGTQQTLGLGSISNLRLPVPPKQEREAIVQHLDSILPSFESLVAEAERAIELLQERRTALISAAVTGKIDVRQFAATETT